MNPPPRDFFTQEAHFNHVGRDYIDNRTTHISNIFVGSARLPLDRLEDYVSSGAAHDSAERGPDAPKCHPETRRAVQEEIMSWIQYGGNDSKPTTLLWLSGPAGSGKTAIAGSISDECQVRGWLAASFFFSAYSGSPDRRLKRYLIPTLAYHLLQRKSISGYKDALLSSIVENPGVFTSRLDKQLDVLILEPLRTLQHPSSTTRWPKVFIIDGLDECDADPERRFDSEQDRRNSRAENHCEILRSLRRASLDPAFPFRIIIASRPEPAISGYFSAAHPTKQIFLDDKYDPRADIEVFARASLAKIGRDRGLQGDWFPSRVPELLTQEASGQFVYITTALRFIQDPVRPPYEQLKRVLEWRRFDDSRPFAALDALYTGILEASPNPLLVAKWLRFLDPSRMSVPYAPWYKKQLLESFPGETEYLLGSLTSLVGQTSTDNSPTFEFYHKSLLDFLNDPNRSNHLCVGDEDLERFLGGRHHEVFTNRGPQGAIRASDLANFYGNFSYSLDQYIDPGRLYQADDIDWWLSHQPVPTHCMPSIFAKVHMTCPWHRCIPTCRIWRKAILKNCKADSWQSWRIPTTMEILRDKIQKNAYRYKDRATFPLRRVANC